MLFRVYSSDNDETMDCNINDIIFSNRRHILIKSIEKGFIMFTDCIPFCSDYACYCICVGEFPGFGIYKYGKFSVMSEFDEDESNFIRTLYDEDITELFQYMGERFDAIKLHINNAATSTKPISNVKRID